MSFLNYQSLGSLTKGTLSISNFKTRFRPVRPNLFTAKLFLATGTYLNDTLNAQIPNFSFRCEAAEFPGKNLTVNEIAGGNGPSVKLAGDVSYSDISLTIICSDDYKERIFFEAWINYIYRERYVSGTQTSDTINGIGLYEYYSNYAKSNKLSIAQHKSSGDTIYQVDLLEVFPTSISSMTANWDERDTYQRFSVTMSYNRAQSYLPGTGVQS